MPGMKTARRCLGVIALAAMMLAVAPDPAMAGKADVVAVTVRIDSGGTFFFSVTVRHHDEGWEHYANAWEVVAPDGTVLATRVLLHPHEHEQPFTRGLGGVRVPAGVSEVTVRALDLKHGGGGREMTVRIPR